MTVQCLYYGHSFIHRYATWVQNNPRYKDGGLRNGELNMLYHGDPGATVDRLLDQENLQVYMKLYEKRCLCSLTIMGVKDLAGL